MGVDQVKDEMARLSAAGPRHSGMMINGTSLCWDDYPMRPGEAMWIKQITDDDGRVQRYYSRQQNAVDLEDIDWQPC